jgi:hypothetical protein
MNWQGWKTMAKNQTTFFANDDEFQTKKIMIQDDEEEDHDETCATCKAVEEVKSWMSTSLLPLWWMTLASMLTSPVGLRWPYPSKSNSKWTKKKIIGQSSCQNKRKKHCNTNRQQMEKPTNRQSNLSISITIYGRHRSFPQGDFWWQIATGSIHQE